MNSLCPPLFASSQLADYFVRRGAVAYELTEEYSPRRISHSLTNPLPCLTPDARFSLKSWLFDVPSNFSVSLQSGLLTFGSRFLYESNPSICSAGSFNGRSLFFRPPGWWHRRRTPFFTDNPLVLLSTHNNPNYYHWLTQPGLTPLFLQQHFCLESLPSSALGLSHRPGRALPTFVRPLLGLFAKNLPVIQDVSLISASTTRFALHEQRTDVALSPAHLQWLHRRCSDYLKPFQKPWRRILVSRRRSSRRRCINETQVFSLLAPHGYVLHCLEDLSVIDQLRLFSESVQIVGVHGAGFSNLIACQPQSSIIELMPRSGDFSHYYAMADVLGLRHGHLVASHCDPKTDDFWIEPTDLIALLVQMELL